MFYRLADPRHSTPHILVILLRSSHVGYDQASYTTARFLYIVNVYLYNYKLIHIRINHVKNNPSYFIVEISLIGDNATTRLSYSPSQWIFDQVYFELIIIPILSMLFHHNVTILVI